MNVLLPVFSCMLAAYRFFFIVIALLAFASCASAQYPSVGYANPLPIVPSMDQMQDELYLSNPAQREDLLQRLGIESQLAHLAAIAVTGQVLRIDKLEGVNAGILFVPCDDKRIQEAHLFLLRAGLQQRWRIVDERPLNCWWQHATYELLRVPGQNGEVVLAHHVNHSHGSGMVQDDMLLLGIRGRRFVTLLEAPEYKSEDMVGEDKTVIQKSTLQPFPDGSVEETRATTIRKTMDTPQNGPHQAMERFHLVSIERRRWKWNKASQSFRATEFMLVKP